MTPIQQPSVYAMTEWIDTYTLVGLDSLHVAGGCLKSCINLSLINILNHADKFKTLLTVLFCIISLYCYEPLFHYIYLLWDTMALSFSD